MDTEQHSKFIILYLVLAFFAVPHLIDDFLFGIPAEFGFSVHLAQVLAGAFMVIYLGILIRLARGKMIGLYSAMGLAVIQAGRFDLRKSTKTKFSVESNQ